MTKRFKEALIVLLVGLAATLVWGAAQGIPQLAPSETSCALPGEEVVTKWVTQQDAVTLHQKPSNAFVDARGKEPFEKGHVAGALHVPVDTGAVADEFITRLRNFNTVVTYCDTSAGCASSTRLAGLLMGAGLPDVRVLRGGFPEWMENGHPAEAGSCRHCP